MSGVAHFIVATAGHVDHGKSALIKALTGIDPDRLPEEKARGITIDLGFAHLELQSPTSSSALHVGIVDVPGHEDFVKNMVAGVGSVDLALIVVAADDGWMPQTEEHLQILTYAGVRRAVVALTKVDLAEDEAGRIADTRSRLEDTAFADAPIVPTSVQTGRGLEALKSTLANELSELTGAPDIGKPRLAVDRVFTLPGTGTVVTGTLAGGTLNRGQFVVIHPGGHSARIRRIQSHGRDLEAAGAGTRTALNLTDVTGERIARGDVIALSDSGGSSDCVDVLMKISPRASRPMKDGVRVRVHHGSGNVPAHVALASAKQLAIGGRELAQLRLEAPIFVFTGDHLTLRDWSEQQTLAGAVVLDPDASRRAFREGGRQDWLAHLAQSLDDATQFVAARVARDASVRPSRAFVKTRFSQKDIDGACARLIQAGTAVSAGAFLVDATAWTRAVERVAALVDDSHRLNPERAGLPLTDLRSALKKEFPFDEVFDALIAVACERGYARSGSNLHRTTHRAQLPEPLRDAGETLRKVLASQPMEPPSRKQLAPDAVSQRALRFLIETGEAVEVSTDLVMSNASLVAASLQVRNFIRQHGPATVSELRQAVGASRRIVVPLLEYLDRTFVTLRQGDKRSLR